METPQLLTSKTRVGTSTSLTRTLPVTPKMSPKIAEGVWREEGRTWRCCPGLPYLSDSHRFLAAGRAVPLRTPGVAAHASHAPVLFWGPFISQHHEWHMQGHISLCWHHYTHRLMSPLRSLFRCSNRYLHGEMLLTWLQPPRSESCLCLDCIALPHATSSGQ